MTFKSGKPAKRYGPARLTLENGVSFEGSLFGRLKSAAGEVVFNTGMVGYPEAMSDPSYSGQILVMTYPLIGNYGVPPLETDDFGLPKGFESPGIQVEGLVLSEYVHTYSHCEAARSLEDWMDEQGVAGVFGVDTRALTRLLRTKGTMLGKIETPENETGFVDPMATDLVSGVSPREVTEMMIRKGGPKIVLVDCGCKASILRSLLKRGLNVVRVPADHYFLEYDFDGLVISNGPGDPEMRSATTRHVEHALAVGKPILGICLGHQILALAAGAQTYKMKFGHRGQNQPCVEYKQNGFKEVVKTNRCIITSQNHGYAVRADRLAPGWHLWFENANDGTVEGIRHKTKPFFGVQFHPEANPGPTDTAWIFDEFVRAVDGALR
jgi:carbamoyl-phosphate synthase small subunit